MEISPEKNRRIPLAFIGVRAPGRGKPVSVEFATPGKIDFELDSQNNIVIIKDITQRIEFTVTYK